MLRMPAPAASRRAAHARVGLLSQFLKYKCFWGGFGAGNGPPALRGWSNAQARLRRPASLSLRFLASFSSHSPPSLFPSPNLSPSPSPSSLYFPPSLSPSPSCCSRVLSPSFGGAGRGGGNDGGAAGEDRRYRRHGSARQPHRKHGTRRRAVFAQTLTRRKTRTAAGRVARAGFVTQHLMLLALLSQQ